MARNAQKEFLIGQSSRSHVTYCRPSLDGFEFQKLHTHTHQADCYGWTRPRKQSLTTAPYEVITDLSATNLTNRHNYQTITHRYCKYWTHKPQGIRSNMSFIPLCIHSNMEKPATNNPAFQANDLESQTAA